MLSGSPAPAHPPPGEPCRPPPPASAVTPAPSSASPGAPSPPAAAAPSPWPPPGRSSQQNRPFEKKLLGAKFGQSFPMPKHGRSRSRVTSARRGTSRDCWTSPTTGSKCFRIWAQSFPAPLKASSQRDDSAVSFCLETPGRSRPLHVRLIVIALVLFFLRDKAQRFNGKTRQKAPRHRSALTLCKLQAAPGGAGPWLDRGLGGVGLGCLLTCRRRLARRLEKPNQQSDGPSPPSRVESCREGQRR
jgi:hypothetical protein